MGLPALEPTFAASPAVGRRSGWELTWIIRVKPHHDPVKSYPMNGPLRNVKHELFAQALARGIRTSEAYARAGYKPDKGNANKLARNRKVRDRVTALLERRELVERKGTELAIERTSLSKEWVLRNLVEIVER